MKIPSSLTNVAAVGVAPINASATVAAGGSGGASVFGGVVFSPKGKPFSLLSVNVDNWQSVLGKPFRPAIGKGAQFLRVLGEAVTGGDGYVVRVVPSTAKYPVLTIGATDGETGINITAATALSFGTTPALAEGDLFAIYPVDGSSDARSIELKPIAGTSNFTLSLYAADATGEEYLENSWTVSMNPEALDDLGYSLYITDVLVRTNAQLQIVVSDTADLRSAIASVAKTAFVGATGGSFADLQQADWDKAFATLNNSMVGFTAVLGMGATDPLVVKKVVEVADARLIDAFADIDASSYAEALTAMQAAAYNSERLSIYFFPFSAKDPYYSGSRAVWPISGVAFCAKAAGVAKVEGAVGGWHYSPAGVERGVITRKECQPFDGLDAPNEDLMYKARINKLGLTASGVLMIDDALTTHQKEDYLRFQHVTSTMDAMSRDFYAMAKNLQHEPDGITEESLTKGMTAICDGYVASGALVPPRNPDEDGTSPYVLSVSQVAIDQWQVSWACCVTGTSRRILGVPALIK